MAINKFRGEHFYLSNMYQLKNPIETFDGALVHSSEAAYCAERFVNPDDREQVHNATDGFNAKHITNKLEKSGAPIHPAWELGKITVMRMYVTQKFEQNPDIAIKLIATGDEEIIEGNNWHDTFWGESPRGSGNGHNWLGRILMDTRAWQQKQLDVEPQVA